MAEDKNKESFLSALKNVTDGLTDVLNVGRVLSIGIPGVIAAIPLLMILSLISTPLVLTPEQRGSAAADQSQEAAGKDAVPPVEKPTQETTPSVRADSAREVKEPVQDGASSVKKEGVDSLYVDRDPSFRLRIRQDVVNACSPSRWFLLLVGTVMMGSIIGVFSYSLQRRNGCDWANLHLPLLRTGGAQVTYHEYLVREYWRFTEFAANFPLALIIAAALGAVYVLLLGRSYSLPPDSFTKPVFWWLVGIAGVVLVIYVFWFWLVVKKSAARYRSARDALVAGLVLFGGEDKTTAGANGQLPPSSMPARTRWLFSETALDEIRRAYVASFKKKPCFTGTAPACAEEWFSIGNALVDLARPLPDTEARATFNDACAKFRRATEIKKEYYEAYYNWARACALAGNPNMAFEQLERLGKHAPDKLSQAKSDPDFKTLRSDKRWESLFKK